MQKIIIGEIDSQMQILDGLRKMKSEAEKKIAKILADVWGMEEDMATTVSKETITEE